VTDENGTSRVSLEAGSLLTASEVAELVGVPRSTIHQWAREGSLPTIRLGRHLRWTRPMVEAWLNANYDEGRTRG
jgi:excisionase family DNA binding protein